MFKLYKLLTATGDGFDSPFFLTAIRYFLMLLKSDKLATSNKYDESTVIVTLTFFVFRGTLNGDSRSSMPVVFVLMPNLSVSTTVTLLLSIKDLWLLKASVFSSHIGGPVVVLVVVTGGPVVPA